LRTNYRRPYFLTHLRAPEPWTLSDGFTGPAADPWRRFPRCFERIAKAWCKSGVRSSTKRRNRFAISAEEKFRSEIVVGKSPGLVLAAGPGRGTFKRQPGFSGEGRGGWPAPLDLKSWILPPTPPFQMERREKSFRKTVRLRSTADSDLAPAGKMQEKKNLALRYQGGVAVRRFPRCTGLHSPSRDAELHQVDARGARADSSVPSSAWQGRGEF